MKYPFEEIDNEIRDSYLRTSQVFDERNKLREENKDLQTRWNSLREWLKVKEIWDISIVAEILDKMNELEGKDIK